MDKTLAISIVGNLSTEGLKQGLIFYKENCIRFLFLPYDMNVGVKGQSELLVSETINFSDLFSNFAGSKLK